MEIMKTKMPKVKAVATKRIPPAKKAAVKVHFDADMDDATGGGAFFAIQKPLIHLIDEYLLTHLVAGKRMTFKAFCEMSGLSVANMTAIINGNRWAAKCNRDTIEKLAAALEIPVFQIYVLSGFVTAEDVVYKTNIDETVSAIYRKMVKDKRMSYRAPTQDVWDTWPMSAKLALCMMYENMIEKVLLRYASA
jgi:hypothetical protein